MFLLWRLEIGRGLEYLRNAAESTCSAMRSAISLTESLTGSNSPDKLLLQLFDFSLRFLQCVEQGLFLVSPDPQLLFKFSDPRYSAPC